MSSRARNLYKQFMFVARDYPGGIDVVRRRVKDAFFKMKDETDPQKIDEAIKKGEYIAGELQQFGRFHKYRQMKKSYYGNDYNIPSDQL